MGPIELKGPNWLSGPMGPIGPMGPHKPNGPMRPMGLYAPSGPVVGLKWPHSNANVPDFLYGFLIIRYKKPYEKTMIFDPSCQIGFNLYRFSYICHKFEVIRTYVNQFK